MPPTPRTASLAAGWIALAMTAVASTMVTIAARVPTLQFEHRWAAVAAPLAPYAVAGWGAVAILLLTLLPGAWKIAAVFPTAWALALASTLPTLAWPTPTPPPGPTDLTVVTVNLYYGWGSGEDLWRAVDEADADLVVLQEVTVQTTFVDAPQWRARFPHQVGQVGDDWKADQVMVFSRFPLTEVERRGDIGLPYVLQVQTPGGPLTVGAVHTANPWSSHQDWVGQLEGLRAWAEARTGSVILVGDFNTTLDHAPMKRLLATGLADAGTQAGRPWMPTYGPAYRIGPGYTLPPLLGLDHVLVGPGVTARSAFTVPVALSDHRGLVARLDVTP